MEMHNDNKYVRVIALDFTKAFDTVRHFTLLEKMARLQVSDQIFNWIVHFFERREHCTKYQGMQSGAACIQASVVQGSGLGPVSYLVTAADLSPVIALNKIVKFADDTYLVIPAAAEATCTAELQHINE